MKIGKSGRVDAQRREGGRRKGKHMVMGREREKREVDRKSQRGEAASR